MFRIGYMQTGKTTNKLIRVNQYYVITIQDKYSKGKLHAIVKGSHLKRRPYHVGVLTEVTFLLSQDLLGNNYNAGALEHRLNSISQKIISKKGFVLDNKTTIDYSDVLLYTDGINVLYKKYDIYVTPLESKIKNNRLTYNDAHSFVYDDSIPTRHVDKTKNSVKKIKPLYPLVRFIHIPKNTQVGAEIEKLTQLRQGSSKVDSYEILGASVPFRIKNDATLILALPLTKRDYSFEAVAHTKDGDSNKISFTIVVDDVKKGKYYEVE